MIAHRLRPIGWVAAVATAAVSLYLVSLRVAAERGALEEVDRQILIARSDIRRLQTELGARASLRQLERWNGDVLALSAPTAAQYLENGHALAAFDSSAQPVMPGRGAATMVVSVEKAPEAAAPSAPALRPAIVTIEPGEAPAAPARLTRVAMVQPIASRDVAMLDESGLGDIVRRAAREAGDGGR
jgi:hypothetical protein